jgi:hypothetical protein
MNDLTSQIAKLEADLAELKRQNEENKEKLPRLRMGQIWRHSNGDQYITTPNVDFNSYNLICLRSGIKYASIGFGGDDNEFTYIGMANDVIHVGIIEKPVVTDNDAFRMAYDFTGGSVTASDARDIKVIVQHYIDKNWPAQS